MAAMAVAGMAVILADRVASYLDRDEIVSVRTVGGERQTRVLPPCKVVSLEWKQKRSSAYNAGVQVAFLTTPLRIISAAGEQGSLSYVAGLADGIAMHAVDDTLHIALDFPKGEDAEKKLRDGRSVHVNFESMVLALPESVRSVCADVNVCLENVRSDSLNIRSKGAIIVKASQFAALKAQSLLLRLQSGVVENLYLDITEGTGVEVCTDSFYIDTEHLTASRSAEYRLRRGECRQAVWEPQTDGDRLDVSVEGRGRIVFDR